MEKSLPAITKYFIELGHNQILYAAIKSLAKSKQYKTFDAAQKKILSNDLRDFKLAGIELNAEEKKRFMKMQQNLGTTN